MQIQAVNDLGNLIFLLFFLATVALIVLIIYRRVRGRQTRVLAFALLACLFAYATVVVAFSLSSETRELALRTDKCFDDWCATVSEAHSLPNPNGIPGTKLVAVTLRVSNRARQAAFRPSQPRVRLMFPAGSATKSAEAQRQFERQTGPQEDLAKRLLPGDTFQTTLLFEVPAATRGASVVLLEGPAIVTRFLAGDENSFLHKKMVYPIAVP